MQTQTFPNGQTLTSSALTKDQIQSIFQQATCLCFGISNKLAFAGILVQGTNTVTLDSVLGVSVGYQITDTAGYGTLGYGVGGGYGSGGNIPANAVVGSILGSVITMVDATTGLPANAIATVNETVYITDPTAGNQVRQVWPVAGAPAWTQSDNVTFVRVVEVDNEYNKVRDNGVTANDSVSALLNIEYTRVWRVFWEIRGPISYDRATLLKTAMQLDFIHDMLSASNLYLMPSVRNPLRLPELVEGKWWDRTDFEMEFYEEVDESIVTPTVASIPIQAINLNGVQTNIVVT